MSLVSRYILKTVCKPLGAIIAILLLLLLAERLVRLLDTTLNKKNSFTVVFEILAYLVPHYLGFAIPAALFLAVLFGFNKLSRDNEIDAMLASGWGLNQLMRPVIILGAAISLLSVAIFGWVQPYARYGYRSVMYDVSTVDVFYLAEAGVFMQSGRRTFILDNLDRGSNTFRGVFVYDDLGTQGSETVTSEHGELFEVPGERRPVLELVNGHRMVLSPAPTDGSVALPKQNGDFDSTTTPLGKPDTKQFRQRGNDERELTLPELVHAEFYGAPGSGMKAAKISAELNSRVVNCLAPLLMPFLALPFALARRRSNSAYRFGLAIILLIIVHEMIQQGGLLVESGLLPAFLGIWLPFAATCVFAGWSYIRTCFVAASPVLEPALDWFIALFDRRQKIESPGRLRP